jgi:iron complex outermembrane receptor protein
MPFASSFAMPRASRIAVALAAACTAGAAFAQDPPAPRKDATTLDRIHVLGTRIGAHAADDLAEAKRRLDDRAGATTLVDAERYRAHRAGTPADALNDAPGVFVQSRFGAEESRLSIRGSGLQRTFHGRGIALLQDGSPLNLADGGFDFQAVEPLAARYVTVYRGANALETGAAVLGGAIDFVSYTGDDAPPADLRVEAGSFGYRRAQAAFAGRADRADGYLSLTASSQDGYRDHAQQDNTRLFGNAGYRFGATLDGRVYLTHVDTRSQLPGNLTRAQIDDDPRQANAGNLALDQRRDFSLDRVAGKLAWSPDDARQLTLSAYYADKSLHHPIFQVLEQRTHDAGVDLRWRGEGTLGAHRTVLIAGVAFAQGMTDDDRFVNDHGRRGDPTAAFEQRASNASAYVEQQTWLDARWAVSLGAQALHATRVSHDRRIACASAACDKSYDLDYSGVSPKVGLRYRIDDGAQVFANVSRSLEPPSFGELSGGANATPVDAQRATSAEIGVRVERAAWTLDAALYRARIDGELLALNDGDGQPLGTVNAGRTRHQGLELGAEWRIGDAWRWSANYLWNNFRFDHDPTYGDGRLAGIPPQWLRTGLRWSHGDSVYVEPNLEWAPQRTYVDHADTVSAPGYAIFGLRVGGRFARDGSWFADARNLGDRRWIAGTNVVADAHGMDGANFLPGEGRALYVGVEWRLR